ncbi:sodium/proton-translocating pyrophosphatase, partial [Anaerolinea sp.]
MDIFGMGTRHGLSAFEQVAVLGVVVTAFLSLLYAWLLRGNVLNKDKGSQKMQDVWETIRIGADSYLQQQLQRILPAILLLTVALFLSVYVVPPSKEAL